MGLNLKSKTDVIYRISSAVGVSVGKPKKSALSPKANKGKKGGQKRKTIVMNNNTDLQQFCVKTFVVNEMIPEPIFRYIPSRATIQRIIMRAANMKDDLAEFALDAEENKE